jgi:hypothetical protein
MGASAGFPKQQVDPPATHCFTGQRRLPRGARRPGRELRRAARRTARPETPAFRTAGAFFDPLGRRPAGEVPRVRGERDVAVFATAAERGVAVVRVRPGLPRSNTSIAEPSSAGDLTVRTPAASKAAYLSAAVPLPPATMAPAWPMRLPGGAVTPAT